MFSSGRGLAVSIFLTFLAMTILAGCNQSKPLTELDVFHQKYVDVPQDEIEDTLWALASGDTPEARFAHYELGNKIYEEASRMAAETGWTDSAVVAKLDEAVIRFESAIALDSTFVQAHVNLGSLWDDRAAATAGTREARQQKLEFTQLAKDNYERAIEISPGDEKARCNLGALYLRQRQTSQAVEQFMAALEHDPNSALAHYNLAIVFAEEKMYREAIVEWEAAAKADRGGDIGERSKANIEIVEELMNTEVPENLKQPGGAGH